MSEFLISRINTTALLVVAQSPNSPMRDAAIKELKERGVDPLTEVRVTRVKGD